MEPITVKSYILRGSRITPAQQAARDRLWVHHGIDFSTEKLDLVELFPNSKKIIMEIGFGMGEATALIARAFPEDGSIAVDVHKPGVGKLLALADQYKLSNLKIIEHDAHEVLYYMIEDKSLDGIHLFFPDPWPKKRHHKRRIVKDDFLLLIARKIKSGGFIHISTDWLPYAEHIQEVFANSDLFNGGVVERPSWRPITRFEGQGITKDHVVSDLRYLVK